MGTRFRRDEDFLSISAFQSVEIAKGLSSLTSTSRCEGKVLSTLQEVTRVSSQLEAQTNRRSSRLSLFAQTLSEVTENFHFWRPGSNTRCEDTEPSEEDQRRSLWSVIERARRGRRGYRDGPLHRWEGKNGQDNVAGRRSRSGGRGIRRFLPTDGADRIFGPNRVEQIGRQGLDRLRSSVFFSGRRPGLTSGLAARNLHRHACKNRLAADRDAGMRYRRESRAVGFLR